VEYPGVISERTDDSIQIALGSLPDDLDEHETWRVDLSSDDVATMRQRRAIQDAGRARSGRLIELRDVLLARREATFQPEHDEPALDTGLNESQQAAVRFALASSDVALIHGPPGTGKTTTVVELIRREVRRGRRVLVCAPSNTAVDNLLEKLLERGEDPVRLGHPARVTPALRAHTLDLRVEEHPDFLLARKLMKEALRLFHQADRRTRAKPLPGARQEARREAKSLLADARKWEDQAATSILDHARIVCATTTGLDAAMLGGRHFDLAVIDEASQSTEPGSWIPLLRCDRVVLAGDHCQLPPTVVSREAAAGGFDRSLFERVLADLGPTIARRLTVQYRMHHAIMEFSSREFYDGELTADATVREHLLSELPGVIATPLTQTPIDFIDTAGASFDEEARARRREPAQRSGGGAGVREDPAVARRGRAAERHRRHRALRGAGAAAARAVAATGARDRQRRWLPGAREGGGRDLAGALEPRGGDRLPRRRAAHERRAHARSPQAHRDRR
jgi:superfamily I DNA and/or RNA helicase